jgi:hypothetical protein
MMQLFIDCDGVLAIFDTEARELFRQDSREVEESLGTPEFWSRIIERGSFYLNLPLLQDAMDLHHGVAHLNPIILTGCPEGGWSELQTIAWVAHHFPGVKMITCLLKDKCLHMINPGDVMVDDYLRYRELWEKASGIIIHHVSAKESITQLATVVLSSSPTNRKWLAATARKRCISNLVLPGRTITARASTRSCRMSL